MAKLPGRKQELLDIDALMSTPAGARFIWRLLTLSGVFRSSFSSDALIMAMNEGQRNIGLRLLGDLTEACPEKYINMMRTAKSRKTKEEEDAQYMA
jgi:hypothetical protein